MIICRHCKLELHLDFMDNWVDVGEGDGCSESPSMVHEPEDNKRVSY